MNQPYGFAVVVDCGCGLWARVWFVFAFRFWGLLLFCVCLCGFVFCVWFVFVFALCFGLRLGLSLGLV